MYPCVLVSENGVPVNVSGSVSVDMSEVTFYSYKPMRSIKLKISSPVSVDITPGGLMDTVSVSGTGNSHTFSMQNNAEELKNKLEMYYS